MKNMLHVTDIIDARIHPGSHVDEKFPYPYTFLLRGGSFACSPLNLPKEIIGDHVFKHGVGFGTEEKAEVFRNQIAGRLAEVSLCTAVVDGGSDMFDFNIVSVHEDPESAMLHIAELERNTAPDHTVPQRQLFTTTNHLRGSRWIGQTLHFHFRPGKRYWYQIQVALYL